jgi:hypothetical protein
MITIRVGNFSQPFGKLFSPELGGRVKSISVHAGVMNIQWLALVSVPFLEPTVAGPLVASKNADYELRKTELSIANACCDDRSASFCSRQDSADKTGRD